MGISVAGDRCRRFRGWGVLGIGGRGLAAGAAAPTAICWHRFRGEESEAGRVARRDAFGRPGSGQARHALRRIQGVGLARGDHRRR